MDSLFLQLIPYGVIPLICFTLGIYCAARYLGLWGILLAHLLVAGAIFVFDYRWIQQEMANPSSRADMDLIFCVGLMLRMFLITVVLLPISLFGYWRHVEAARRVANSGLDATP